MHMKTKHHPRTLTTIAILCVLFAAFWLRVTHFNTWPPGLSNDEANNANDALRFARTFIIPFYQFDARPEPLYRLIQAVFIGLVGPSRFGARLASLFLGFLSVAAAYRAGRHLAPEARYQRWFGLAAAAALAVMVSHIHLSRVAYRALLQVPASLLFFDAFVTGWNTGRIRPFIMAGVWLGVALLSYTAALVLIPVAIGGILHQIIFLTIGAFREAPSRAVPTRRLLSGGVAFLTALLIAASPLITLNIVQPNFYARASEVSSEGEQRTPLQQVRRVYSRSLNAWDGVHSTGDINPQYNVARAPLISFPPLYWLLWLGIAASVLRFQRLPNVLVLAMLVTALFPVALSDEIPHGLRIAGEFAAIPLVIAAGLDPLVWAANKVREYTRPLEMALTAILTVVFIAAGVQAYTIFSTYYTSDVRWGDEDVLSAWTWFFETDRLKMAEVVAASDVPVYVPLEDVNHTTGRYFTVGSHPRITTFANYFDADGSTITLPPGIFLIGPGHEQSTTYAVYMLDGTLVLLPRFDDTTLTAIQEAITTNGEDLTDGFGSYAATQVEYDQPIQIASRPAYSAGINYNNQFTLVGWDAPFELPSNEDIEVTLYFAPGTAKQRDVDGFSQIWNWENERIASSEGSNMLRWLYPPDQWADDDIVPVVMHIQTPEDIPPGAYFIAVGLTDHLLQPVPILGADGVPVAEVAIAGAVKSPRTDTDAPPNAEILAAFGDQINLRDYAVLLAEQQPVEAIEPGQTFTVTLAWQAVDRPVADYTAFLHVVDSSGEIVAQSDVQPGGIQYPSGIWSPGEVVTSDHIVTIPPDAEGPFLLYTGLYSFPSLERLPVKSEAGDNRYRIVEFP